MAVVFRCRECGKRYRVSEDKAGARVRCKDCSAVLRVPDPDQRLPPSRPARDKPKQGGRRRRPTRYGKLSSNGKWILAGASVVAVAALVVIALFLFQDREAANSQAVVARVSSADASERQPVSDPPPGSFAVAPDSGTPSTVASEPAPSEDAPDRSPADDENAGSEVTSLPTTSLDQTATVARPSDGYLERIAAGDRTFIPAGCEAIGVIQLQQLWNRSPLGSMLTAAPGGPHLESLMRRSEADYGFELRDIREVVAFGNRRTVEGLLRSAGIRSPGSLSIAASLKPRGAREVMADRLYQIVLAFQFIYDDGTLNKRFPRASGSGDGRQTGLSWRVHLLPFIGGEFELYSRFRLDEPWDSDHNRTLISEMPDLFKVEGVDEPGRTSMHVFTGPGTPFGGSVGPTYGDFTDGDDTLLVVVAGTDTADIWTKPGGLPFDPADPAPALGTITGSEIQLATLRESQSIRADIDARTLARLIQHQDGEEINPPPWFVDSEYASSRTASPAWMLSFSESYDREQILQAAWSGVGGATEETVDGRSLFAARGTAVHFIDNRSLLLGSDSQIRMMLQQADPDESLTRQLSKMSPDRDIILAVDTAALKDLSTVAAAQVPALEHLPDTETLAFSLNLSGSPGGTLLEISATLSSPETARRAEVSMRQRFGETQDLPALVQAVLGRVPDPVSIVASQLDSLIDLESMASGASVTSSDAILAVSVPIPNGMDQLFGVFSNRLANTGTELSAREYENAAKTVAWACLTYHDDHRGFPRADRDFEGHHAGLSWRVHILPYLDELTLYEQFRFDEPWDSPHNSSLIEKMPACFRTSGVQEPGRTALHVFTGDGTPMGGAIGVSIDQILDDTTKTLMLVSAGADAADVWTKPGGLAFDPQNPLRSLGKPTDRGWLAVTFDSASLYLPKDISPDVLSRLIQHRDGQRVVVPGR